MIQAGSTNQRLWGFLSIKQSETESVTRIMVSGGDGRVSSGAALYASSISCSFTRFSDLKLDLITKTNWSKYTKDIKLKIKCIFNVMLQDTIREMKALDFRAKIRGVFPLCFIVYSKVIMLSLPCGEAFTARGAPTRPFTTGL